LAGENRCEVKKIINVNVLAVTCSALWLAAGVNVVRMGLLALKESRMETPIMVSGIIIVFILFATMFCRISVKNMKRIQALPRQKQKLWNCMPPKSFVIMAGMIALGVCLRSSEAIPRGCIASFYIGLGSALTLAGLLYLWNAACTIKALIPNIISASRGVVALVLLFTEFRSPIFWVAYLWCGVSDMIDGLLARKMNVTSKKGALVDSIADLLFVAIAAVVFLPQMNIPAWTWICIGLIALTKFSNIVSGFVLHKRLVMPHTIANKVTGLLLFLLPIALEWIPFNYAAIAVIAVALFASVQEGHFIRTGHVE